ncbi:MAG: small multi-drug export protein [Chloroflexi bacterium]|nr:small multi-drug export protein [Chloroflexota bacterium]
MPLAMASGLDAVSAFFWSVLGNATPILLVHFAYDRAMRSDRLKSWMHRLVSDRATARFNRWGLWFVLIATPWTGVWVMAATSKVLRARTAPVHPRRARQHHGLRRHHRVRPAQWGRPPPAERRTEPGRSGGHRRIVRAHRIRLDHERG